MTLKFVIMSMLLLAMPMAFAQAPVGYGYGDDDDDGPGNDNLDVSLESTCDGNVVTVTSHGDPLSGAKVTVQRTDDGTIASGNTNSNGELSFEGCGWEVSVYANKDGYNPETIVENLIDCAQCEEEVAPIEEQPEPEPPPVEPEPTPPEPEPEPEPVCPGECGTEPGCSDCPGADQVCEDNVCVTYGLDCDDSGFVADEVTCTANRGDEPCVGCPVTVQKPDGTSETMMTDENGQVKFPLEFEGQYSATLAQGNEPSESTQSLPISEPEEPEPPPTQGGDDLLQLLFLLLLLLGLVLGIVYYRRRSSKR